MHSALNRFQNVFGFFTTVAFCTAACVAVSSIFFAQNPSAIVELRNVQVVKGRPHYYSPKREEYAHIKFDLDADLRSLFNWNTKQVFVWLQATYPSTIKGADSFSSSQAVIWDTIISSKSQLHPHSPFDVYAEYTAPRSKNSKTKKSSTTAKAAKGVAEPGIVRLKNNKPKYQITDITGTLASQNNVTLELGWNIQPWVGPLIWTIPDHHNFWRWQGISGGRSKAFDLPSLKGKITGKETIVEKGTPEAAQATPIAP